MNRIKVFTVACISRKPTTMPSYSCIIPPLRMHIIKTVFNQTLTAVLSNLKMFCLLEGHGGFAWYHRAKMPRLLQTQTFGRWHSGKFTNGAVEAALAGRISRARPQFAASAALIAPCATATRPVFHLKIWLCGIVSSNLRPKDIYA
jgi:hypothetical protein